MVSDCSLLEFVLKMTYTEAAIHQQAKLVKTFRCKGQLCGFSRSCGSMLLVSCALAMPGSWCAWPAWRKASEERRGVEGPSGAGGWSSMVDILESMLMSGNEGQRRTEVGTWELVTIAVGVASCSER